MARHALILGCGRSGTSIFGELFEQLPEYTYFSEPDFSLLTGLDYSRPIAAKVPRESPDFPADPGLSFPLKVLWRTVPKPRRLFWQLRHPLDAIASLKVGISRNWGHHPRPPDWENWLDRPLVARCAYHWNYLNSVGYQQVADRARVMRFEDMLTDPLGFASRVARLVDVDPASCGEAIRLWAGRVQNTNNAAFVEARTSRPYSTTDHRVRIGRWRENLTEEELSIIRPLIRNTAARFSYDILLRS